MSIRYSKWHLSQSSLSAALIYFKTLVNTSLQLEMLLGFLSTADGTEPQYGCGLKC